MEYLDYEGLESYHDKLKKLFTYKAGTNITIDEDNTISATCSGGTGEGGAVYTAGNFIDISDDNVITTTYTEGDNIDISDTGVISAIDTTYTAGDNINIDPDDNNKISYTGPIYSAGANINISTDNVISATNTTYSAGENVQINGTTISATDTTYTAGRNITIEDNVISAIGGGINTEEYNQDLRVLIHAILKSYKKHDHLECINKAIAVALHELKQFELLWENE